jgi:hypothetical protein
MVTSNLDWDDEALEDKFLEGLKPEIRKALIYYPTEPRNLEELFERAQKIDREIWGQRNNFGERGNYRHPKLQTSSFWTLTSITLPTSPIALSSALSTPVSTFLTIS